MKLPTFKYHPDPIATEAIRESGARCECCGEERGYIYTGPVYAEEDLLESFCPWCIAEGSAHEKFDAEFADAAGIGEDSDDEIPASVIEEVAFRTSGFSAWQQERWLTCCGDVAAYIGMAGRSELEIQSRRHPIHSGRLRHHRQRLAQVLEHARKRWQPRCLHLPMPALPQACRLLRLRLMTRRINDSPLAFCSSPASSVSRRVPRRCL